MVKRAICLGGGGPAVGLSLGALKRLKEEHDINFDVWSCACIGAWTAAVWNQAEAGREWETTESFFRGIFRPDEIYARFPIASPFAVDLPALLRNYLAFVTNPQSYRHLVAPQAILTAAEDVARFMRTPGRWSASGFNTMFLNNILAVNPLSRFLTSMIYLSPTRGLARLWYEDSELLKRIDFQALRSDAAPQIYINAYNISQSRLEQFTNRPSDLHGEITSKSLCACSALPYIEEPVEINGDLYCEGATIDVLNVAAILDHHPDLDEIWVSRIVDKRQVRAPENLHDALNNLVMLFAASVGEEDVRRLKETLRRRGSRARIIEIPVDGDVTYDWTWSNLQKGIDQGYHAVDRLLPNYRAQAFRPTPPKRRPTPKAALIPRRRKNVAAHIRAALSGS